MRINRTRRRDLILTAFVVLSLATLAVVGHASWTADHLRAWDRPDESSEKSVDHIFSDGFETGDQSGWDPTAPNHCPVPALSLPIPAKKR